MKQTIKPVLILFVIGTLVSAQQVSSRSLFMECDDLDLERLALTPPDFKYPGAGKVESSFGVFPISGNAGPVLFSARADTVETFDIELEEEKGTGFYKELAAFIIVAAMVGYMLVTIIKPDEEEETDTGNGKDIPGPFAGFSVPISR